jgi:hypothetical protein
MASEQVTSSVLEAPPPPQPQLHPLQAWLARLGLSGKLLAIGGLVGLIAVFLPLVSMSFQMPTSAGANAFGGKGGANLAAVSTSQTVMVVRDFRGVLCLLGYLAALALTYVLYAPTGLNPKTFGWVGVGVGALVALLALWLLVGALSGSGSLGGFQISVGIGAILNLLAAATVAAGGALKAREEKLI